MRLLLQVFISMAKSHALCVVLGHQVCPAQAHGQHCGLQPCSPLYLVDSCSGRSLPAGRCCQQDCLKIWTRAGKLALLLKAYQKERAGGGSKKKRQRKEGREGQSAVAKAITSHKDIRARGSLSYLGQGFCPRWTALLSTSRPWKSFLVHPSQPTPAPSLGHALILHGHKEYFSWGLSLHLCNRCR